MAVSNPNEMSVPFVDGLGHTDDGKPFLTQTGRGAERAVTTDHDKDLDARVGKDRLK
jgi:hypothetical protein